MKYKKTISLLVLCIAALSMLAASAGVFSDQGPGPYEIETVRGRTVMVYGKGIYKHMSVEVAPQGIAQDSVCGAYLGKLFRICFGVDVL